jgi:DNA-binding CsgD family transcriptional regulator
VAGLSGDCDGMGTTCSVDEREAWFDDVGAAFAGSAEFATTIVEGEPGMGKSTMLDAATLTARREGLLVLQARCSELESTYDYAMVRRLLDLARLEASATRDYQTQRPCCEHGAASGPDVEPPGGPASRPDMVGSVDGLYAEVSRLAVWRPVVIAVDDLQWCDASSASALVYLARRTVPGRILLLGATLPHTARHETDVADDLMAEPTTRVFHLRPLPAESVSRLVQEKIPRPQPTLLEACLSATRGNPFLVQSLLAELRQHAVSDNTVDATTIDTLAPRVVARSIRRRLAAVPAHWLRILQVTALLGDAASLASVAELAEVEPEDVVPAVDAMVDLWLLRRDETFRFCYPLERSTVYAEMPPAVRAQAHARAARMLADRQSPAKAVARHLVLAEPAGDPWEIEQLEECADQLLAEGQEDLAVRCLSRVLREPLDAAARGRLLLAAAAADSRMAADARLPYLRAAVELEADAEALAASALDLGRALPKGADRAELATLVGTIAGRLDDDEGANEEVRLRLELVSAAERPLPDWVGAGIIDALLGGRREGASRLERQALAHLAAVYANDGRRRNADAVAELAQQLVGKDHLAVADPTDGRLWCRALTTLARAGRLGPAAVLARQAQAMAKAAGEESAFLEFTSVLAYVYLLHGSLELAEEECRRFPSLDDEPGGEDTSRTAEATQQARAVLAAVLEGRGRRDEACRLLERGIPRTVPGLAMLVQRGRMRVEEGNLESGLADLREATHRARQWEIDNPAVSNAGVVLAGALHASESVSEAWELARHQVSVARAFGAAWSLGAALRAAATVAPPADRHSLLAESVEVLEHSGATLELAQALVELGAFLVAQDDGKEAAREVLRRAADAAFRCSATPLVHRAQELLRSTGARPRRVALTGADALTPMERRVAELAHAGHANLEIAELLFVNNKTVEAHLSRVYRKLHIRSRRQLPSSLARAREKKGELELTGSDGP